MCGGLCCDCFDGSVVLVVGEGIGIVGIDYQCVCLVQCECGVILFDFG